MSKLQNNNNSVYLCGTFCLEHIQVALATYNVCSHQTRDIKMPAGENDFDEYLELNLA